MRLRRGNGTAGAEGGERIDTDKADCTRSSASILKAPLAAANAPQARAHPDVRAGEACADGRRTANACGTNTARKHEDKGGKER